VEPNKKAYASLLGNHRKSQTINTCFSLTRYSEEVTFDAADVVGGIVNTQNRHDNKGWVPKELRSKYQLDCFPFYTLLLAIGNRRIDFLSLDVEGAELAVLKTIPWSLVDIRAILIEVEHSDSKDLMDLLLQAGYKVYKKFGKQDILLVKS